MKKNFIKKIAYIAIGLAAIIFAVTISSADPGSFESSLTYGGDAYTGIQNAAAQTANNIKDLSYIVRAGFSYLLSIIGLLSIAYGLFCKEKPDYTQVLNEIKLRISDLNKNESFKETAAAIETISDSKETTSEIQTDVSFISTEKTIE